MDYNEETRVMSKEEKKEEQAWFDRDLKHKPSVLELLMGKDFNYFFHENDKR